MTLRLLDQIRLGIDHIEQRLHDDIDLRSVSHVAGMSHSSFQRAFRAVTGETLKGYVRSRRLAHALELLETTELRVLDVALAAGYETQESFAKAFKASIGITPMEYRRGHRARTVLKRAPIDGAYLEHLDSGGLSIEPVIEERDETRFVGVSTQFDGGDRQRNTLGDDIEDLWVRFLPVAGSIPEQVDGPYYGVIHDAGERSDGLGYLASVASTVEEAPSGLGLVVVPPGRWAVFAHHGLPSDIDHTVNYIYGSWLVRSPDDHAGGPDLEIYGADWKHASADSVIHYAIPLR